VRARLLQLSSHDTQTAHGLAPIERSETSLARSLCELTKCRGVLGNRGWEPFLLPLRL